MATAMVALVMMPENSDRQMSGRSVGIGIRLLVGLGLIILLLITLATGLANVVRSNSPELALRLAPWNGPAAAQSAQQLLFRDPTQSARALRLAQRALRRDPTLVAAVTTRGAVKELKGQPSDGRRDFVYAAWLSRRHLPTELWWIEYSVAQGDIPLALRHYDIALRAIRQAPDILFPILGAAIAQPEVHRNLLPILRAAPGWRTPFFQWLATNGVDYSTTALLLSELRLNASDLSPALYGRVENGLIDQKEYASAWHSYRSRHPNAVRNATQDTTFRSAGAEYHSPFDWNIIEGHGEAFIGQEGRNFVLSFATIPTNAAQLARQTTLLPAGRYTLRDDVGVDAGPEVARPYWLVQCIDGRKLAVVPIGRKPAAIVNVPADCPVQQLILASDAVDAPEGSQGRIRSVVLKRDDADAG